MSQLNQHRDRDGRGRLLRGKYRGHARFPHFPDGEPKWWRHLFHIIQWRRASARRAFSATRLLDPDDVLPPHSTKPHIYFW